MLKTAIFAVFLLTVSAHGTTAQVRQTDRDKANLFGPVRSVTSTSTEFTGDKIEGKGFSRKPPESVSYDEAGNELEEQMVSDFGEQMGKTLNKFDTDHRLLESRWLDPNGKVVRKDVFTYTDGRLKEITTFDDNNVLREKTVHVYDEKARLIEEVYYDPAKPVAQTVYKYIQRGTQPAETAFFLIDGRRATAPVGPCLGAHRITSSFDEKGRVLTQDVFEDTGALKKEYRWTYDDRSNVTTYTSKSPSSTVTFVYSYEFDAKGNWIKQIARGTSKENGLDVFGKPAAPYIRTVVTTRKIVYF